MTEAHAEVAEYLSPFIADGYTLTATIPAAPGHWSEVQIRYRPMSADDESEIWAKVRAFPLEPKSKFEADVMARKILGWDIKDRTGQKLSITAANIGRLSPQFFDVLKSYVDGTNTGEQEKNS